MILPSPPPSLSRDASATSRGAKLSRPTSRVPKRQQFLDPRAPPTAGGGAQGRDDLSNEDRKDLADDPHLAELARDPAHGGNIDLKSLQEARVGRSLEDSGRLSRLRRDPTGGAELIDQSGQAWDVKGYHSGFQNGYNLKKAMGDIRDSAMSNENVILDTTNMTPDHVAELRSAIAGDPSLAGKVRWWP